MSIKRSAFSVFREKGKSPAPDMPLSSDEEQLKLISVKKKQEQLKSCPSTPKNPEKIPKTKSKSEQRLNSIRKSIRKKSKSKETHHEVELSKKGKENKLERVVNTFGSKNNWTESLQSLNSSKLEEEFLPDILEQKREQRRLHSEPSSSSLPEPGAEEKLESRKRSHSTCNVSTEICKKPPIPIKKVKTPSAFTETSDDVDEKAIASADKLFAWIVSPVKSEQFFSDVWQKKPLYIRRRQPTYNDVWFSTKEFDKMLRQQNVQFTKNLDIAVFRNGIRETLNPDGRAFAPMVWKFYKEGCSIRLLNPATFSSNVWHLCAKLQEFFGCFVGANVYLTPAGSQGFAPHYDDIEAFVIQLEGKKRWRLYSARDMSEVLARRSSENMSPDDLGEPILDRVLEAGDALYFPRGTIHQAVTPDDSHSLHITLSVFQKCCWSDLLEKLIPMALQTAIEEDVEFRKALPISWHNNIGMANSEKTTEERRNFIKTVEQLMKNLVSYASVDQAADELALDQMEEYLPPSLTSAENVNTVFGAGSFWENGKVKSSKKITMETKLRLLRPGIVRLVPEEDTLQIHHTIANSRQYKESSLGMIEVPLQFADVVEYLLLSYPEYVVVRDAPIDDDEVKLDLARKFYEAGLLCFA